MPATSYLRKKIVDWLTGNDTYTPPALFLSAHTADPGIEGSHAFEVFGAGYARQPLDGIMGDADPVTGISVNTATITFGPAEENWGTITHLGLEGALVDGDMLAPGIPSTPKTINTGLPFQITPGNLKLKQT